MAVITQDSLDIFNRLPLYNCQSETETKPCEDLRVANA